MFITLAVARPMQQLDCTLTWVSLTAAKRAAEAAPDHIGPDALVCAGERQLTLLLMLRSFVELRLAGQVRAPSPTRSDLRSFRPPRQILFLLRCQPVDLNSHGLQLQPCDAFVQLHRNRVHGLFQRGMILDHVLHG